MHRHTSPSPLALSPNAEEPSLDTKYVHKSRTVSDCSVDSCPTDSSIGYGTLPRKTSSTGSRYSAGSHWSPRSSSTSAHSSFASSKRSSRNSFGDISASESDASITQLSHLPAIVRVRSASASSSHSDISSRSTFRLSADLADLSTEKCPHSDPEARQCFSYWSGDDGASDSRAAEQERELEEAITELAIEKGRTAKMANMLEEQERERLLFACRTLHGVNTMKKEIEKLNKENDKEAAAPRMLLPPGLGASWQAKASLPVSLENPNSTLWNGDVVVGGHKSGDSSAVLLRYSLATNAWTTFKMDDWVRVDGTFTHNGQLYIMTQTDIQAPGAIYCWAEKSTADGEDTWEHVTTLPSAHGLGSAVVVGSQLVVTGGVCGSRYSVAVDVYHFTTGQWTCLPNLKTKRCFHSSMAVGSDRLVIYGGTCEGGASESCSVEQLDLNRPENCMEKIVTLPHLAASLALSSSLLFSCGGFVEEQGGRMEPSEQFSIWSTLDPQKAPVTRWISLPGLEVARAHTTICFTSAKTVLAVGGVRSTAADDSDDWSTAVEELTIP